MSRSQEVFLSGESRANLGKATVTMRRIRNAATVDIVPLSRFQRARRLFTNKPVTSVSSEDHQETLRDAEYLADSMAGFLIARINGKGYEGEYNNFIDVLNRLNEVYEHYRADKFAKSGDDAVDSVVNRLYSLQEDPNRVLKYEFVESNDLGIDNVHQLINKEIGLFAPLASDFLIGKIYSRYINERIKRNGIDLKPVALSADLQRTTLPLDANKVRVFDGKKEIGFYFDVIESGSTATALHKAVLTEYSDKRVLRPEVERERKPFYSSKVDRALRRRLSG